MQGNVGEDAGCRGIIEAVNHFGRIDALFNNAGTSRLVLPGDLTGLVSNWFDTEVGGKREADSYRVIAARIGLPAERILFLSDVVEELDAAREAGLQTCLIDRLDDYPTPREGDAAHGHPRVASFADIPLPH